MASRLTDEIFRRFDTSFLLSFCDVYSGRVLLIFIGAGGFVTCELLFQCFQSRGRLRHKIAWRKPGKAL